MATPAADPRVQQRPNGKPRGARVALECRVGRELAVLVPVEAVAQVIEYEVWSPPPLANPWIGGFALHEKSIVVSVALDRSAQRRQAQQGPRASKGVRLAMGSVSLGWVLEIDAVAKLVDARVSAEPVSDLSSWLVKARTRDERDLAWLDVAAMVAEIGGS